MVDLDTCSSTLAARRPPFQPTGVEPNLLYTYQFSHSWYAQRAVGALCAFDLIKCVEWQTSQRDRLLGETTHKTPSLLNRGVLQRVPCLVPVRCVR